MFELRPAPVLGILFGLFMLLLTYWMYKKKRLPLGVSLIWFILWLGFIAGILLFDQMEYISGTLLRIPVFDFFLYMSILVLFMIAFLEYNEIKANQKKIDKIVEGIALHDAEGLQGEKK